MTTIAENRRARFDYLLLEIYEAGLELQGQEVKSVKGGRLNLSGSFVVIRRGEAWLTNAQIPAWQPKNAPPDYDPKRSRRLLLHKSELAALAGRLDEKGLVLVPLKAFLKKNLVKLEVALARSRKHGDKRDLLKKRTAVREMRRND